MIRPSDLGKVSQEEFIHRIEVQLREQARAELTRIFVQNKRSLRSSGSK